MAMKTVPISRTIKRRIRLDGHLYTVIITAEGIELRRFRHRTGRKLNWSQFWFGTSSSTLDDGCQLHWSRPAESLVSKPKKARRSV